MTIADAAAIGVPCLTFLLAAYATYAGPLGTYLGVLTHNALLGRIVSAGGRYASELSDTLAALPAGSPVADVKAALLKAATAKLSAEFATSAATVGATDSKLMGIIAGQLTKPAPVVLIAAAPAVLPSAATTLGAVSAGPLS